MTMNKAIKLSDIKVGDTIEYVDVLDEGRGYVKTHRGAVARKAGYNIELESGDWWYWHDIKRKNVRIVPARRVRGGRDVRATLTLRNLRGKRS